MSDQGAAPENRTGLREPALLRHANVTFQSKYFQLKYFSVKTCGVLQFLPQWGEKKKQQKQAQVSEEQRHTKRNLVKNPIFHSKTTFDCA